MGESNLGTMFAGFAKRATALGQSVSKTAAEKAAMIAETVTAHSRIHMDYEVAAEVGQCGPEGMWKIHRARPIKNGAVKSVSVWILNKAVLQQSVTGKTATALLEADIRQTNLLKHPGVVRILEPLEETRNQFLLVTEEVIGSLDSWLKGRCRLQVEKSDTDPLSVLEIKHGLQKVAETLSFVHDSCKRVHCNVSPQTIILAADGTWKLAGFGLSQPASTEELPGLASKGQEQKRFSYDYESTAILDCLTKPELAFCAPEVVSSVSEAPITGAADTFSLACVAYRMLRGQSLFTAQTTSEYRSTLASMNLLPVDALPDGVQAMLRSMLSSTATQRPQLQNFISSSYFRDDRLLRALYFLDSILQRETAQKHAFINDLPSFLPQFPPRVLRHRVLPVLMQQWQDDGLKDAVLPLVLRMVKDLPADIFQDQVLPELRGILETANGAQLLRVLGAVPDLQAAMRVEQIEEVLMPLLLKGLASGDTRIQEEVLTSLKEPLKRVRAECIHKRVLPQLLKTCVDTKSASVRAAVLQTLTGVAPRLTEQESDVCARMVKHLTAHEASDSTLSHVLALCEAINSSKSAAYAARTLLPLLSPLLTTSSMTAPTFSRFMVFLRAMLDKIEDRLHGQKASSNPTSTNGAAVAASWDDAVPAVPSAASSNSAQGLGFMDNDFLSAWSTPVTSPSSTAASSTAPPSAAGQSSSTGTGMRPPAAKAALFGGSNGASGLGVLLDMPLGSPASIGASGLGGLGHTPMRAAVLPPPQNRLNPGQPQTTGMGAAMGMSRGSGLASSPQMPALSAPPAAAAATVSADPFADLLGGPMPGRSSTVQKPAPQQSTTWDPFA